MEPNPFLGAADMRRGGGSGHGSQRPPTACRQGDALPLSAGVRRRLDLRSLLPSHPPLRFLHILKLLYSDRSIRSLPGHSVLREKGRAYTLSQFPTGRSLINPGIVNTRYGPSRTGAQEGVRHQGGQSAVGWVRGWRSLDVAYLGNLGGGTACTQRLSGAGTGPTWYKQMSSGEDLCGWD